MACKGLCEHFKVTKAGQPHRMSYYDLGGRFCSVCSLFVKWDGVSKRCKCCKMPLRSTTHDNKSMKARRVNGKYSYGYVI